MSLRSRSVNGVICCILLMCLAVAVRPAEAAAQKDMVVTVYFCGTAITQQWSDPKVSKFFSPELVSSLYKDQLAYRHASRKFIVDGIGTGSDLASNFFAQGFPSNPHVRGWKVCLTEGRKHIEGVIKDLKAHEQGGRKIVLNLVGHSRGGVLAMWMAYDIMQYKLLRDAVRHINILAFDPVPGDSLPKSVAYALSGRVNAYVGIYAEDERSRFFAPVVPEALEKNTKVSIFAVPGSHETLVGNLRANGHSTAYVFGKRIEESHRSRMDELAPVHAVTRAMAMEVLGSRAWGSVRFGSHWRAGKTIEAAEKSFLKTHKSMRTPKTARIYAFQRRISFLPWVTPTGNFEAFGMGKNHGMDVRGMRASGQENPRSVIQVDAKKLVRKAAPLSKPPWGYWDLKYWEDRPMFLQDPGLTLAEVKKLGGFYRIK